MWLHYLAWLRALHQIQAWCGVNIRFSPRTPGPVRLVVRTPGSHPGNRSSTLLRAVECGVQPGNSGSDPDRAAKTRVVLRRRRTRPLSPSSPFDVTQDDPLEAE